MDMRVVVPGYVGESESEDLYFCRIWQTSQAILRRRARYLVRGDQSQAEDLLANTALKALLYLRRVPERVQDLQGLLFVVLEHVFLDGTRRKKREDSVFDSATDPDFAELTEGTDVAPSTAHILETRQSLQKIAQVYERLSPDQQRLFELRFEEAEPYEVIAQTLQISEALARKRVELLRRRLRKALDEAN